MAEVLEQLKKEIGEASVALAAAKKELSDAKTEMQTLSAGEAEKRVQIERRAEKLEADVARLNKEHDEITVRLQDPSGNLPGVNPSDLKGRLVARSAWAKFLRNANAESGDVTRGMSAEEKEHVLSVKASSERRSIYVSNDEMGGFLVSPVISQRMIEQLVQVSPVRALANVMGIGTSNELVMPKEKDQITAAWTAERGTRTDSTPSGGLWSEARIPVHGQTALIPISNQMIEDAFVNIEAWIEGRANRQFQRAEGIAFISGDGNGKPRGLTVHPDVAITTADNGGGAGTFTPDKVQDLLTALETEYAMNGTMLGSRTTLGYMRKFKDNQNRPLDLVQRDALAKIRQMLVDGYPFAEMPAMASAGTASALVLLFGDIREAYTIVDRSIMTVIRDPFTSKATGMTELLFTRRVGGDVVQPAAVKMLRASAS